MDEERQETADWRIVWQMFFPCVISDLIGGCVSGTFRYRLIGSWGVRRYYQKRKGETLLSPAEQQQVVALARKLGVRLDEYFDGYVEEYDW